MVPAPLTQPVVLLTGFDPFGGQSINPSWQVAQALQGRQIGRHRVVAAQLPTVFGPSLEQLMALLEQHQPALVLCLGLAGGRSALSLERVAINVDDARIPDNAGGQPVDQPVVPGAPAAYFSTLPIKAMLQALQGAGIDAELSQTAGTFVCNHVFFGLMHRLAQSTGPTRVRGGFIHLPWLPTQGSPSLPLAEMVRGIRLALDTALRTSHDVAWAAGSEC